MTTKDLDHYFRLPYRIILHPDETGGYVAAIPDLPGCVSQGETAQEALAMLEDAKRAWIEIALEDGIPVPEPDTEEYSGRLVVRMPRSLHRALARQAREENVSLNQLILYHLARGAGLPAQGDPALARAEGADGRPKGT